jgi:hypothetical protein
MLEKFRDLSRETKIVLLVLSIVGLIFVISLVSNSLSGQNQQTEQETTTQPPNPVEPEPSENISEEEPTVEEIFPQEDSEGNLFLEDGIYSEEFGEEKYYSDDQFYYEAVDFLTTICMQSQNETFEEKFAEGSNGQKYMTSTAQYEKLFFNEIFATNCKPLTGEIFEENEETSFQSVIFNVYLESELSVLNGIRQVTYYVKLVKEEDGYHVTEAEMNNHEVYK